MHRILIIGVGAIGSYLVRQLRAVDASLEIFCVVRPQKVAETRQRVDGAAHVIGRIEDAPADTALAVECGGHGAVAEFGTACLDRGWDFIVGSVGALADQALHGKLHQAACKASRFVWIPAGAIAGIDALVAARRGGLDRVRYTSRKPPTAWKRTHADTLLDLDGLRQAAEFLRTDARQAALLFPQNANVAATVALAGVGFERTEVSLNADPGLDGNVHLLEAWGPFGQMRVEMRNRAFPDNPKTSMLAGLSLLQAVLDRSSALRL